MMGVYGDKAKEIMKQGSNCCQAVVLAFKDEFPVNEDELYKLSASFGGGMGYLGLTCGALAGAGMVFGNKFGTGFIHDPEYKKAFYAVIKKMGQEFEENTGALNCADLKSLQKTDIKMRSCLELAAYAADLAEKYLKEYENGIL